MQQKLAYQLQAGHVAIFPWEEVKHLLGLCLSPLVDSTYTGIKPWLVYDFFWGGLNDKENQSALKEAMRLGIAMHRLGDCIMEAYPALGPTVLSMLDLIDTYMHIWVWLGNVPAVTFLVPNMEYSDTQLLGFYLSI